MAAGAVAGSVATGLIPQWRARTTLLASRRIARSSGSWNWAGRRPTSSHTAAGTGNWRFVTLPGRKLGRLPVEVVARTRGVRVPAVGTRVEGRSGPRSWAAAAAWGLWGLAVLGWVGTGWLDGRLREAGMAEAAWFAGAPWAGVVAALSAATVGALIAGRRHRHPVGWLLLGLGLGLTYQAFGSSYSRYGLVGGRGCCPGPATSPGSSSAPSSSISPAPPSSCCSPPPGRCRRPAGGGGPGSWPAPGRWAAWRRRSIRACWSRSTRPSRTRCPSRPCRCRWGSPSRSAC